MRSLSYAATFVLLYLVVWALAYALSYVGASSTATYGLVETQHFTSPVFLAQLMALASLIGLTAIRGRAINRRWLVVLPAIAATFDLVPALHGMPLVPILFHLGAIVIGATRGGYTHASRAERAERQRARVTS